MALAAAVLAVSVAASGCLSTGMISVTPPPPTRPGGTSAPLPVDASGVPLNRPLKIGLCAGVGSQASTIVQVYRQLLSEEGFPFEQVDPSALEHMAPQALKKKFIALILPEDVDRNLTPAFANLVERYVTESGGKALIAYDAGTEDGGAPRTDWLFSSLTGIESLYPADSVEAGGPGPGATRYMGPWVVPVTSPLRRYFEDGVMNGNTATVRPFPAIQEYHWLLSGVHADALAFGQEGDPDLSRAVVTSKPYPGGGVAVYINGRPGALKVGGNNDFMMRGPLKYFLTEVARAPRLMASPQGLGGLVLSIHVCSGVYLRDLAKIMKRHQLSGDLKYSFEVTAGPDSDVPGDGKGFDASNPEKGLPFIKEFLQYGSVGAQGGWIHNYWAYHFNDIPLDQKRQYIDLNFSALAETTGRPVTEYAAPGGIHSSDVDDFIAAQGVKAAAIPTAYNAPPTHGWFDGKLEDRFWLFGYTGTQYGAAMENMLAKGRSPEDIEEDVRSIVDTAVERQEVRQFYSHPISIAGHPDMWEGIQSYILQKVEAGALTVRTMSDFADFLNRQRKVEFTVEKVEDGYRVLAHSTESLMEMTFAVPLGPGEKVTGSDGFPVRQKDGWAYVTVDRALVRADIDLTTGK